MGQQSLGHRLQRRVAGGMTVLVVDGLEPVEVKIDQAGRGPIALGKGAHAVQFPQKPPPVQQRRQRVAVRQVLRRLQSTFQESHFVAQRVQFPQQGLDGSHDGGRHFSG